MTTTQTTALLERVRSFFRPTGYMSGGYPIDRDTQRAAADLAALR